jgi:hypothetical protein
MIRHGHAGERRLSSKDYVAPSLPLDYETNPLECFDEIPPETSLGSFGIKRRL